jgi:hypothetical protein
MLGAGTVIPSISGQLPERERNVSISQPRRAFNARVVALIAAALVAMSAGVLAGYQLTADDEPAEDRAAPDAPSRPEFSLSPEPETTSLTPVSPDESLTEISPLPEPTTESPDPSPTPTPSEESDPPSSPVPDPSASPGVDIDEELIAFCESAEPFDYWDSAELREVCEEQAGNG